MPRGTARRPRPASADAALDAFFRALPPGRARLLMWLAAHPLRVLHAVRSIHDLPLIDVAPSDTADGRVLAAGLARRSGAARRITGGVTGVIRIPDDRNEYAAGAHRRSLRKQRNEALRLGVHWVRVDGRADRERLLALANEVERTHPEERYRTEAPDNRDLLPLPAWWLALSKIDEPLLLAVVAVDEQWALLRYFRVLRAGRDASAARYLMTAVLVEDLAAAGVRVLATDMSPVRMSSGLRDFQHRVGFELVRVRTVRSRPSAPPPSALSNRWTAP